MTYPLNLYQLELFKNITLIICYPTAKTCRIMIFACKFCCLTLDLENLQRVLQSRQSKKVLVLVTLCISFYVDSRSLQLHCIYFMKLISTKIIFTKIAYVSTINSKVINLQKYPYVFSLKIP